MLGLLLVSCIGEVFTLSALLRSFWWQLQLAQHLASLRQAQIAAHVSILYSVVMSVRQPSPTLTESNERAPLNRGCALSCDPGDAG